MPLTRLDNLISSKTGRYLYVSPDDFNASDELDNRGNSPNRPFVTIQRAFIEVARYSYAPGIDNDRFDEFTIMLMPGDHYIDNRPGLATDSGTPVFSFDQFNNAWTDSSVVDLSNPDNVLHKFNDSKGGCIVPRGCSLIGYDLRRTIIRPLYVPDPADKECERTSIFNVTGGAYIWQFTIKDGDITTKSPLYDANDGVGKVYYRKGDNTNLAIPEYSHHKITVFQYAEKDELDLYYQKVGKSFAQYQPTIDDQNEFGSDIRESRIVGPLSDLRSIESIQVVDSSPVGTVSVNVTTKIAHGYIKDQFFAVQNNGLDDALNGTFSVSSIDTTNRRRFSFQLPGTVASLGLQNQQTYNTGNGLNTGAFVQAEVDSVQSASPYMFNLSIRSTWGICGLLADGSKATGFKSMVCAQYTGVSLQKDDRAFIRYDKYTNTWNQASLSDAFATVPYHTKGDAYWKDDWRNFHIRATNDSFIQCVSIFAVGFADHFLMESGGDMSITNSNSNFGNTSLHAIGHKGYSFAQDKGGYLTDIVPPKTVDETSGNTKRQSYYTLDVYASNDSSNNTKVYLGDDGGIDPTKRLAATIGGYRIGAKTDDKLYVKLNPRTAGGNNEFFATLEPSGFKKFTTTVDILNPSGVTINNKTLDAADRIEANKDFIAHEAYDRILAKYPALKVKETITITKCRRDVGYLLDAAIQDLRLGGNVNTIQAAESYYVGNNLSYITGELTETLEGYNYAKDLALAAMRNFTYLRTGVDTTNNSAIVNIGDTSGVVEGMTVADYDPAMFTNGKLNTGATRPTNPVIPNNTFVKKVIDSTSIELGDNAQTATKQFVTGRFGDARALILANKTFIATEAYERMLLDFPSYTPSSGYTTVTGKAKCIDDLEKAIDAIADNTGYGGNAETWDAADYYERGAVVDLAAKKTETLAAFNYCKDMAIQVMRKEDVFIFGTHGLTQSKVTANDPIATDQPELVNDRNGDARNLILANKNLIAAESVERMVLGSSVQKFTPTAATYNAETGEMVLTSAAHGMLKAGEHTVTNAAYTPADGKLVLTIAGHGFTNGQRVLIKDDSLSLQCTMDASKTKKYPRASDHVSGKWLTVSNVSTDTFTVNVGATAAATHNVSTATYDPATGVMVLTIGNHTLKKGTSIRIAANSLTFTCAKDSDGSNHTYPRSSDPFYNKAIRIDQVTGTTITLFVGKANDNTAGAHTWAGGTATNAVTSGGNYTHTYVSAVAGGVLSEQDAVRIDFNALNFTCGMDGNATQHSYPRISDPAGAKILPLVASTADTFTINVGKTPTVSHDVTNATYDPATGDIQLTVNDHKFAKGQTIRLADESLKFKCSQDSFATTHAYPRASTTNLTPTAAAYNPVTGLLTFTLAAHGLENKDLIKVVDESLTFRCDEDSQGSDKLYPRATDPISGKFIPVSNVTATTFDIQVLDSAPSTNTTTHVCNAIANDAVQRRKDRAYQNALEITKVGSSFLAPTDAAYTPANGELIFTKTAHGLSNGDRVKIARDSLTFTCAMDSNATEHSYPRASDPADDSWLTVSDATADTFKVSVGVAGSNKTFTPGTSTTYDPASGDLVLDIGADHGLSVNESVLIENGAVSFKCTMDGNDTAQAYPRNAKDKASGRSLSIKAVTGTSITVNVGNAGTNKYFKPSAASYNAATGVMVATVGQHGLRVGDDIVLKDNSLTFTCSKDNDATNHSYPRPGTDPKAGKSIEITAVSSSDHTATGATYDPLSGDLTVTSNGHGFNGPSVFTPTDAEYNPTTGIVKLTIAGHGLQNNEFIKIKDGALKFKCAKDGNVTTHAYPRSTDPASQRALTVTNVTTDTFDVKILDITPSTNTTVHQFVPALTTANSVTHGGDYVQIVDGSLTFKCELDGKTVPKQYPRAGFDYPSGRWLQITSKTTNTFTINVGKSSDTSVHEYAGATASGIKRQTGDITFNVGFDADANNQYTHAFVSAVNEAIQYLPQSAHTFDSAVGSSVKHEPAGAHTFKRSAANAIQKQSGTITVNVGASAAGNQYEHQFVAATDLTPEAGTSYNPTTGVMTITSTGHGMQSGDYIKIADGAVKFKCDEDSKATEHAYPRPSDPISNEWTQVTVADANNFTVQVLADVPSTNTTDHEFVSGVANSIKRAVVVGGGNYTHTFKSAKSDSVHKVFSVAGNRTYHNSDCIDDVVDLLEAIADNVAYGGNDKTWDAAYSYKTGNHVAGVKKTVSGASYDPATGDMSLTIGTHTHKVGERVRIPLGALTFRCSKDSNATPHSYPRVTDPIASFDPEIKSVTGTAITVNVGPANDNTAGVHQFDNASKQIIVGGEETETNIVFDHAKDMAGQVIKNQKVLVTGSHGLTQTYDTTITAATQTSTPEGKFGDAYNLLNSNAAFIAAEAYERMQLHYPTFLPPTGNKQDCIDDIKDFITEVSYNTGFGGNDRVWDMAQLYVTGAHVAGEETQTIEAFQDATQLAIQVMRNEKVLAIGNHGLTQTYDTTITGANETPINNKAADASILLTLNKQFIADIAQGRMLANNGGYTPPVGYSIADCNDDLKDIVDVLAHNIKHGGNDRVWDTANLYVGGAVQGGAIAETVEAINHLKDVAIQVVQNVAVTVGGHTALSQVNYPATNTGTGVDSTNPKCQDETSAITTLVTILTNAISTHSTLKDIVRTQSTYKCTTVESAISTLSTIVQNAITTPESLEGIYRTVSSATYNPTTGLMVLTVGSHSNKVGDKVHIKDGSIVFTCDKDSNATEHAYPRSTDPISKVDPTIAAVTPTTITVDVGMSVVSNFTPTNATYNPTTGDLTLTIGNHSLTTGTSIEIAEESLKFSCPAATGTHNYVSAVPGSLKDSSNNAYNITDADYTPTDGTLVLTTTAAGSVAVDDVVTIAGGGIKFTCDADDHATEHDYPRATDPVYNRTIKVIGKTGTTITLKVGKASETSESSYPRSNGSDYAYNTALPITAVDQSGGTITVNVNGGQGAISINSAHTFVSATSSAISVGGNFAHTYVRATSQVQIGGVGRTISSGGRCDNVRDTIDSLFKIVTDTISVPASLNVVTRNISNGPCQNVASAITSLFKLVTDTIGTQGNLSSIERTVSPTGLSTGNAVNATANTTNSYVYFTLPAGRYTSAYTPDVDDTITQDTGYPQCNSVSDTVRQYFANITTIIQTGVGTVTRTQPSSASSDLSARSTIWGLKDWTPGPTSGSNPHQLETGTPVRLVPRPRYNTTTNLYVEVDKRNVRLPNGFDTNTEYYVIAPGRNTKPENYSGTTTFNGSDQTKLMLASSKDNAAAGIYIHSAEVEAIHPDVEIDIYQFVLDDKYDLHQYSCELDTGAGAIQGGLVTDIPHIFDVPNASVAAHKVFFRKNEGGNLPIVGTSYQNDTDVADSNNRLRGDKFFYAKYHTAKVITIHKTHADAISGQNEINFVPLTAPNTYNFSIFADKRESPMKYDPSYDGNVGTTAKGKWYLNVKNESSNTQSILGRFHDTQYNDASGNNKTNDSWFERIDDSDRTANDRIYRLRYVIPKYLKSVRDPLNGFTIKMRKDETRKLLPQKIKLKQVTGNVTKAKFFNTSDSGNANEIIGYTDSEFTSNSIVKTNAAGENIFYDPYKKDTKGTKNYLRTIETYNNVSMSIQSGRYYTESSNQYLELTVFDHGITNVGLKNETFTTVKITTPQGNSTPPYYTASKTASTTANAITWSGNSSGSGYVHAVLNVPGTEIWHLILKGVSGDIKYSSTDNIRFTQGSVFADLLDYPDGGKSLVLKDLIKEGLPEYYYRQNGAKVYTVTPGDVITDADGKDFYVESVEDAGEIDDTFYVYDVQEIQRRIFDQQDGIFYITAIRGNISPYPTGAGNQKNFHNFKFSQPISKLYPLDYKNDPVWFKQIDPTANDPGQTYSAADNYVHGLVSVNDFKGSTTKESIVDFLATEALKNNNYAGTLKAQDGNSSAGSEDRKIPIAGDSTVVVDQRIYVELRRPSIARAGNHTFEYLGFGPGNYSTGFPAKQEVLLSATQDFYSQSKKQNGGLVFYTGLNSNGDLYIGNRKIDAITGEEVFLESANLVSSDDDDDKVGNLVTTFDTPVTFNEYITVNGGEDGDKTNTFNSPVTINVQPNVRDATLGEPNIGVLSALKVTSNLSSTKDDSTLDRTAMTKNRQTAGDIIIAGNRVAAGVFQFNQRGSNGSGQGYKIQTHVSGTTSSNITPDQGQTYDVSQVVSYGSAGAPITGDILLKGESVGGSGSLGWIYSNVYSTITGQIEKFIYNSTRTVTIQWKSGVTNANAINGESIIAGQELRLAGFTEQKLLGTWLINTGFTAGGNTCTFSIAAGDTISNGELIFNNTNTPNAVVKIANASWKEVGVLGSQTIRTDTQKIGEYKLGVNTVARAAHVDYADAFVSAATDPLANLDVVGTAWISGKTIENFAAHGTLAARTLTAQDHAFMVGGDSATANNAATFRVSTTNSGRVGINTTKDEMQSAFTTKGTSEFTDTATFQNDIAVNGGGAGSANHADITTTIEDGTATLFNQTGFVGLTSGTRPTQGLLVAGSARNIEIGNVTTASQNIKIGNTSTDSQITIGDSVDGSNSNKSRLTLGGAFASTESDSFVQIDTKALKIAGDTIIGTRRGLTDTTKFESPSGTVEFLSGNSATSTVAFATNASTLTIAGQGGTTTIRNNLVVDSTARFNASTTLCGGNASYSFIGYRAQAGSGIQVHTASTGLNPTKNVSLINVVVPASIATVTAEANQFDGGANEKWGGNTSTTGQRNFQGTPTGLPVADFPDLVGTNKYYLPLKVQPFTSAGVQYYNENDILLLDTVEQSGNHAEFVKVTRLVKINDPTGIWIEVERLPFGTLAPISTQHPDDVKIYKCNVQYDATWTTAAIDAAGTEDDVYLAEFGGNLVGQTTRGGNKPGDYVIISRTTTGDDGEIFELKTTLVQTAKTFSVKRDCDGTPITIFEVNSVTGDVTINGDQTYTGALTLNGTCSTPYTNSTTNKKLTITNGSGIKTFEVDTCTGDTVAGNTHGTVFMKSEEYGSSAVAHTKGDTVYVYSHDPLASNTSAANIPITVTAQALSPTDTSCTLNGYSTVATAADFPFQVGDYCAIFGSSFNKIEVVQITATPTVTGSAGSYVWTVPFTSNSTYTNGGRGSASNKIEGTVAQTWSSGTSFVRFANLVPDTQTGTTTHVQTTTLLRDIPAGTSTRAADATLKARTPNNLDTRLEIPLANADLIPPKYDRIHLVRIGEEWFTPDSVDGTLDAGNAVKMPKQYRNPNTVDTPPIKLYDGGKIKAHDDVDIYGGNLRLWGSDGITPIAVISNDDGHIGDGSFDDPKTGYTGLTVTGRGTFYGDLTLNYKSCVSTGTCTTTPKFKAYAISGKLEMGQSFYMTGDPKESPVPTTKTFTVDGLGSSTSVATGSKPFSIYQTGAIDSFGIEKYWTANGGRRQTYVEFDSTAGVGQQQGNPLAPNNNYIVNATSGSNMILYLPGDATSAIAQPQTGDMIRFIEVSGNLTYNTSLILRANKIGAIATAIQGDTVGTRIQPGSAAPAGSAWDSGELIIQTRNASFGLVFIGQYDLEGSANARQIPNALRGWWLMEL